MSTYAETLSGVAVALLAVTTAGLGWWTLLTWLRGGAQQAQLVDLSKRLNQLRSGTFDDRLGVASTSLIRTRPDIALPAFRLAADALVSTPDWRQGGLDDRPLRSIASTDEDLGALEAMLAELDRDAAERVVATLDAFAALPSELIDWAGRRASNRRHPDIRRQIRIAAQLSRDDQIAIARDAAFRLANTPASNEIPETA